MMNLMRAKKSRVKKRNMLMVWMKMEDDMMKRMWRRWRRKVWMVWRRGRRKVWMMKRMVWRSREVWIMGFTGRLACNITVK